MILQTHAKKTTGLSDLFKDYVPQQIEERQKLPVGNYNNTLRRTLLQYDDFIAHAPYDWHGKNDHNVSKYQLYPEEVLTPDEINQFLQITVGYERNQEYESATGMFLTQLIKKSYKAGYNDFSLDTRKLPLISELACELHGTKGLFEQGKSLKITIHGNVGAKLGYRGSDLDIILYGNADQDAGVLSRNCTFTIHGLADHIGMDSTNILMKTSNRRTFGYMSMVKKGLIWSSGLCRGVVFIDQDGREVRRPR